MIAKAARIPREQHPGFSAMATKAAERLSLEERGVVGMEARHKRVMG